MPDFEKIIKAIETILNWIFGGQVPAWIFRWLGYILVGALGLLGIYGLLLVLSKIKKLFVDEFLPLFYDQEEKHHRNRRRRFADHVESEIRRLNNLEVWSDYRFAELEAEVEAEGRRRTFGLLPFTMRTRSGLRRERSLSKALESSQERLILLEGDPGSGKSVALRHVAQAMARRAMKARSTKAVIPIYINLKELVRYPGENVDKNLLYAFILKSLNRVNDRDIEEFLEEEFDLGLREGTWLFLFDSFDELPEVLSSTEADETIRSYADAISDFLHGMNQCRGIVASRQFRGPGRLGWPRFRILPLSEERRLELVRKADLKPELEKDFVGRLGVTSHEIRSMAINPMFLGLLCDHVRNGNPFPENPHNVFETYIGTRLTRDKERLWRRFELEPTQVRVAAENLAFCMASDLGLGLSPTRRDLENATIRLDLTLGEQFNVLLDALEYIKLARSETATAPGESKPFTFAHRRFQEYFATCVVLREPDRVSPRRLLTDARWRETMVVMCQTQPPEVLSPILEEARDLLTEIVNSASGLIDDPLEHVCMPEPEQEEEAEKEKLPPGPFPWPFGALHILGLLQSGFGSRLEELPDDIQMHAGRLILSASSTGTLSDKKWGLEVAGIVPQPILLSLLRDAFESKSQWLQAVAYRQAARLGEISDDIAKGICHALVHLFCDHRLRRERYATHAHLMRLDRSAEFHSVLRFLLLLPFVDLVIHIAGFIVTAIVFVQWISPSFLKTLALASAFVISHLSLWQFALVPLGPFTQLSRSGSASEILPLLAFVGRTYSSFFIMFVLVPQILTSLLPWMWQSLTSHQFLSFLSLFVSPSSLMLLVVLWTSFVFLALWPTPVLVSDKLLRSTGPLWWLRQLVLPLMFMILLSLYSLFARDLYRLTKFILPYFLPLLILAIIKEFIATKFAWPRKYGMTLVVWFVISILIIGFIGLVVRLFALLPISYVLSLVGILLLLGCFSIIRDWVRYRKWVRSRVPMTMQEILKLLDQDRNGIFCSRLVRNIREQNLLVVTESTQMTLERLAIATEHAILATRRKTKEAMRRPDLALKCFISEVRTRSRKKRTEDSLSEKESTSTGSDFFDLWLAEYTKKNKRRLSNLGTEFLDEICKLLEKVRASKQDQILKSQ